MAALVIGSLFRRRADVEVPGWPIHECLIADAELVLMDDNGEEDDTGNLSIMIYCFSLTWVPISRRRACNTKQANQPRIFKQATGYSLESLFYIPRWSHYIPHWRCLHPHRGTSSPPMERSQGRLYPARFRRDS